MTAAWAYPPATGGSIPGLLPEPSTTSRHVETYVSAPGPWPCFWRRLVTPSRCPFIPSCLRLHPWPCFGAFGSALDPARCKSSVKPPMLPFLPPGTTVPPALPTCTASCLWCSGAICRACLPLLLAHTPPATARASPTAHHKPSRTLCTERFRPVLHVAGPCFFPACS
jgi:hypothetical protein